MRSPSPRSATQPPQRLSSSAMIGRALSSRMTQPSRDTTPGSNVSWRFQPSVRSSVRMVPCRLPLSSMPGCHTTLRPFIANSTDRLSAEKRPPRRHVSVSASVRMVTFDEVTELRNDTSSNARLTMPKVALSSKRPSALHSMRIMRGVSTVKRALPATTVCESFARGR